MIPGGAEANSLLDRRIPRMPHIVMVVVSTRVQWARDVARGAGPGLHELFAKGRQVGQESERDNDGAGASSTCATIVSFTAKITHGSRSLRATRCSSQ